MKVLILAFAVNLVFAQDIDHININQPEILVQTSITPDKIESKHNADQETRIILRLEDEGTFEIIASPKFDTDCHRGQASTTFQNKWFEIRKGYLYDLRAQISCNQSNILTFNARTNQGQMLKVYDLAHRTLEQLRELDLLGFWRNRITLKFPSNGDYYRWDTVNITKGYQWDVVGHEIGHAIYDQADIGSMGGGSHRIDECYTGSLALSEGWASFFSAWLSLDLNDSDAKFEYLVPRRAPIQIENVPSDVCAGPRNEWRVSSFLWDLIDHHNDGESVKVTFKELWKITENKRFNNITQLAKSIRSSIDPVLVNIVYKHNFLEEL